MKVLRLSILLVILISCEHREFSNPNDPINLPRPPELLEPTGGVVSPDNPPTFRWKSEEESDLAFEIQVSEDRDFDKIVKDADINSSDYRPYGPLFREGEHFWRVRAKNREGTIYGDWSEPDSFSVKFPLIGRYSFSSRPIRIERYKGYGYVVTSGGLEILDLKEPKNPQHIRKVMGAFGHLISIRNGYLYSASYYFKVYSLSDPTHPESLSCLTLPLSPRCLLISDRYAYIGGQEGVKIIEILEPTDPRFITTYQTSEYIRDLAVKGDTLFIALGDKIEIVDIKFPNIPSKIGEIVISASHLYLLDNLLYCVDYETIHILDVSSSPVRILGEIELLGDGEKIIVREGKIFIQTEEIGIWDAGSLKRLGSFGRGELRDFTVQDGCIYLLMGAILFIGGIE